MARRHGPAEITVKARRTTPLKYRLNSRTWTVLRAKHKAHSKTHHLPCWLAAHGMCLLDGIPIDYDAPPGVGAAYETDHVKPRITHPHLMYVWSNLRPSHATCNRSRQAKPVGPQHVWVRPKW